MSFYQNVQTAFRDYRQPMVILAIIHVAVAVMAFIKDIWMAAYAGTTLAADALTLAFFLPDSIGNNMLAAAIGVSCVPIFSRLAALGQWQRLRASITLITSRFLIVSIALLVIGYAIAPQLTNWFDGSSTDTALAEATLPLLLLLLPTLFLFVWASVGTAVLQTRQQFYIPALAPLLYNFIALGGVVYCSVRGIPVDIGVSRMAIAILLGVGVMTLWIVTASYRSTASLPVAQGADVPAIQSASSKDWVELLRIFAPYLAILFTMQAVYMAERYIIISLDSGAAAALNYAFRLTMLPIWVIVSAISIIILPALSKHLVLEQRQQAHHVMLNAFRIVILIVVPSMLFLFFLREPILSALFQRGAFDARSVALTANILEGYSLTILSLSISLVCLRYFLAGRQLTAALIIYALSAVITIALMVGFSPEIGPRGIGYAAAIGALIKMLLLLYMLWRTSRPGLGTIWRELLVYRFAFVLPILWFGVARWLWLESIVDRTASHPASGALLFIVVVGGLFLAIYYLILRRFDPRLIDALHITGKRG